MPISKIERLPADVRREIDERIVAQGFRNYQTIAADLQARGIDINFGNLYARGRKLRAEQMSAADQKAEITRVFRRMKNELERAGIRVHGADDTVGALLSELGALRLRERIILARLSAVADLAENAPEQT